MESTNNEMLWPDKRVGHWGRAFVFGIIGAFVMVLIQAVAHLAGFSRFDLVQIVGAIFTSQVGIGSWILGMVIHLLIGGMFGWAYAGIFEWLGHAGAVSGLIVAIPHALASGGILWAIPGLTPTLPEHSYMPAPGFMAANYGSTGMLVFVLSYLAFGLIVGAGYRVLPEHAQHPPSEVHPAT